MIIIHSYAIVARTHRSHNGKVGKSKKDHGTVAVPEACSYKKTKNSSFKNNPANSLESVVVAQSNFKSKSFVTFVSLKILKDYENEYFDINEKPR